MRSSYGVPALVSIAAIVALMTALAAWLAASITRPLALLTGAAAAVSREGLESGAGLRRRLLRHASCPRLASGYRPQEDRGTGGRRSAGTAADGGAGSVKLAAPGIFLQMLRSGPKNAQN